MKRCLCKIVHMGISHSLSVNLRVRACACCVCVFQYVKEVRTNRQVWLDGFLLISSPCRMSFRARRALRKKGGETSVRNNKK